MKKSITYLLAIILTGAVTLSCKKDKDSYYGPELGVAQDNFTASALTASNTNPNFLSQTVYFNSTFNGRVRWTLTLVGQTSGAIKILSGVSDKLDASNSVWDGSTDTLKQFRKPETVKATLTVLGWTSSLSTTLIVGNEKNRGTVLGRFENITVDHTAKNWLDATGLYWFYSFETNEYDLVDKVADPTTPEGLDALKLVGHDANSSYYIGQAGLSAPAGVFNFGPTTLNDFYFNIYVKGSGTEPNKDYKFVIQVFEDDNGGGIQYDGTEDKFTYTISLKYDGWKLYRIKYSDFVLDPAAAASPYKDYSPDKIANIGFFFGANTAAGLSSTTPIVVEMDYFSITTNGPMIP